MYEMEGLLIIRIMQNYATDVFRFEYHCRYGGLPSSSLGGGVCLSYILNYHNQINRNFANCELIML